jgi:hypothetical protein
MAGKYITESKETRRHDREARRAKSSALTPQPKKVSVQVQGVDGHVYYMLIDAEHLTKPPATSNADFAGFATLSTSNTTIPSNPIPTTIAHAHIEELEYLGWMLRYEPGGC